MFELFVAILAVLGWIWVLTSFGKFIVRTFEYFENKKSYGRENE